MRLLTVTPQVPVSFSEENKLIARRQLIRYFNYTAREVNEMIDPVKKLNELKELELLCKP